VEGKPQAKEYRNLSDLAPWDENPFVHPEAEIALLRQSLRTFGQYAPLITYLDKRDGRTKVLKGNGLAEAMAQEGFKLAWVEDRSGISLAKARALVAGDNEIARLAIRSKDMLSQLVAAIHAEDKSLAALAAGGDEALAKLLEEWRKEPGLPAIMEAQGMAEAEAKSAGEAELWEEVTFRLPESAHHALVSVLSVVRGDDDSERMALLARRLHAWLFENKPLSLEGPGVNEQK
jgi:hypothetical protein